MEEMDGGMISRIKQRNCDRQNAQRSINDLDANSKPVVNMAEVAVQPDPDKEYGIKTERIKIEPENTDRPNGGDDREQVQADNTED